MTMMANTNRMWMNPPIVELVTIPSAHRTSRTIAMVINIKWFFLVELVAGLTLMTIPPGFVINAFAYTLYG